MFVRIKNNILNAKPKNEYFILVYNFLDVHKSRNVLYDKNMIYITVNLILSYYDIPVRKNNSLKVINALKEMIELEVIDIEVDLDTMANNNIGFHVDLLINKYNDEKNFTKLEYSEFDEIFKYCKVNSIKFDLVLVYLYVKRSILINKYKTGNPYLQISYSSISNMSKLGRVDKIKKYMDILSKEMCLLRWKKSDAVINGANIKMLHYSLNDVDNK